VIPPKDGDNHHRIVCRRCGRTEDAGCVTGEWPCLKPAGAHGFAIDAAEVVFRGLCPGCAGVLRFEPAAHHRGHAGVAEIVGDGQRPAP
jgi:hypothetical protein